MKPAPQPSPRSYSLGASYQNAHDHNSNSFSGDRIARPYNPIPRLLSRHLYGGHPAS